MRTMTKTTEGGESRCFSPHLHILINKSYFNSKLMILVIMKTKRMKTMKMSERNQ